MTSAQSHLGIAFGATTRSHWTEVLWFPTMGYLLHKTVDDPSRIKRFRTQTEVLDAQSAVAAAFDANFRYSLATSRAGICDTLQLALQGEPMLLEGLDSELRMSLDSERLAGPVHTRYRRVLAMRPYTMDVPLLFSGAIHNTAFADALALGAKTVGDQLVFALRKILEQLALDPAALREQIPESVRAGRRGRPAPELERYDLLTDGEMGPEIPGAPESSHPTHSNHAITENCPVGTRVLRPNGMEYVARAISLHQSASATASDVDVYQQARRSELPVLLYGAPGTGKTAAFEAAFQDMLTIVGSGDTEVADFVGSFVQMPDGSYLWSDGPLLRAMEGGQVLLVDEIGLVDPKVLSVLYSAMDGRQEVVVTANPQRGIVRAKPGFFVVAATNPKAPGVCLSEALLSRFLLQLEVGTDYGMLMRSLGVRRRMVRAASNLEIKRVNGELSWAPQARECLAFEQAASVLGEYVALGSLIASAPEFDRDLVAETLSRVFGYRVTGLKVGN